MTAVLAAVAGAIIVAGVLLVVAGLFPALAPAPRPRRTATTHPRRLPAGSAARAVVAFLGAAVAWLVTGWPVAALIVAATVWGLPILLGTSIVAAAGIDRVEALEEWTRRLSDVLVVGVGLEQGIAATARTCPQSLQGEVSALAARLDARWSTEAALRAFADDLDDAAGDLVVATLILGARRRGPGLALVLAAVADSVAEEVAMRRRVEAERAKPRTTARAVTLITLGVVAVGALNGTYLAPYGTLLGQLVLAVIACGFIASLAWMRALTLTRPQPRLFLPTGSTRLGDAADPARTPAASGRAGS
jgi:hypothetical protein